MMKTFRQVFWSVGLATSVVAIFAALVVALIRLADA